MRTTHSAPGLAALALALAGPASAAPAGSDAAPAPAVALLVADQGPYDARPIPWWAPAARGGAAPTRAGEGAVAAALGSGDLRLVELTAKAGRVAAMGVGGGPLPPPRARELARVLGADVLVHGTVVAADEEEALGSLEASSGMKGSSTGRQCTVAVSLRAHRADTGQVVGEVRATARSTAFRAADCTRSAAAKAAQAAAPELRERVLAYWRSRPAS